jgi:hypothetical protein
MMCSRLPALTWLVPLLLQAACGGRTEQPPAESVEVVEIAEVPHVAGTNLPRWAACWFPHRADPGAVRRAQPCPPEAAATTIYTPRDLEGCWLLTGENGKPPYESAFFSAPIRLAIGNSARLRAWAGRDQEIYPVQPLAHIPDSVALDTALMTSYWSFAAPDSVSIIRTTGFTGLNMSFRVRGDSLVGMGRGFTDVIEMSMDTTPDPVTLIRGRRVPCPPADPVGSA